MEIYTKYKYTKIIIVKNTKFYLYKYLHWNTKFYNLLPKIHLKIPNWKWQISTDP